MGGADMGVHLLLLFLFGFFILWLVDENENKNNPSSVTTGLELFFTLTTSSHTIKILFY